MVVLAAGRIVDHYGNSFTVFGSIFSAAAGARMIGLYFLTRMSFPVSVTERRPQASPLSTFTAVFKDSNFVRLLLFTGLFGMCLYLGWPFYSVYVLKELPMTMGDLRKEMHSEVSDRIVAEITKTLTSMPPHEIERALHSHAN